MPFSPPPPLFVQLERQDTINRSCNLHDFEQMDVLGRGSFGEVLLVRKKIGLHIFAMKVMRKKEMVLRDQIENIWCERQLLISDNPWFVQLHYSFQDNKFLYLVMDFCPGGDLMQLLIVKNRFTDEDTKFYMSELACAINEVHKLNFAHRDLKPDNILIDSSGHVKLTDFGLCSMFYEHEDNEKLIETVRVETLENPDEFDPEDPLDQLDYEDLQKNAQRKRSRFKSVVGTPDYMAPEIFLKQGYTKEVDWWAFGAILFECVCGYAPFASDDPYKTARRIVNYKRCFHIPPRLRINQWCQRLMKSLICHKDKRIGFQEIKTHDWFRGIEWDNLRNQKSPWIPHLICDTDTVHFDNFGSPRIFHEPGDTPQDHDQEHFRGFSWDVKKGKRMLEEELEKKVKTAAATAENTEH